MCIIAASKRGKRQPTFEEITAMFVNNPHGAGYMVARDGKVQIRKGFMTLYEYLKAIDAENFTDDDPVVYHCRISTQAGIKAEMTHPFPWSSNLDDMELLDCDTTSCGFAHNGIIRITSDPTNTRYSDTAIFITKMMPSIVTGDADLRDPKVIDLIDTLTESKWAIMDSTGFIATVGRFNDCDGVLFSNYSYESRKYTKQFTLPDVKKRGKMTRKGDAI